MEVLKDPIFEYNPDTMQVILEKYGLAGLGRMEEAVKILDDWVKMQAHFRKKNFPRRYLESTIVSSKGSLERSKLLLDKYCTLRTLLPQYFGPLDVSSALRDTLDKMTAVFLPKLTKDHNRVYLYKIFKDTFDITDLINFHKYSIALFEYAKIHDYADGVIAVLDFTNINLMDVISKSDIVSARHASDIQMKGFGTRLINYHIVSDSKMVGAMVTLLKQLVSEKLADRIMVHKTPADLPNYLDKSILPKDYGGEEKSILELRDLWIETLCSEEHRKFLVEMRSAGTDETLRSGDKFVDDYAGMPGTFRVLKVD